MATPESSEIASGRRRAITAGLLLGMTLGALESTVVSTAMPTVIATLGGLAHYSWVFSAYLLTSTASVPIWGRLSDLYGRRPMYLIGIAVFLAGSALLFASVTTLLLALSDTSAALPWLTAAIVLTAALAFVERRASHPILPLELLGDPLVVRTVIVAFIAGSVMFGAIAFVPLFV